MKKTAIGLVLMFILAIILYVFNALGGFNEIEVSSKNLGQIELAGIYYRGTPQDAALGESFRKMENLQKSNIGAILHTIYYIEPAGKLDTMEVFVGIEKKWADPSDLTEKTFDASQAIVAEIKANRWVMPGPNKVKSKIESFAKNNELPLPNLFIDQIKGPEEVRVIAIQKHPVK
ncbi:MAG: hypothetical protein ACXIUQ_13550 [Cecembia sp.]